VGPEGTVTAGAPRRSVAVLTPSVLVPFTLTFLPIPTLCANGGREHQQVFVTRIVQQPWGMSAGQAAAARKL
jgi:hypothetical protein